MVENTHNTGLGQLASVAATIPTATVAPAVCPADPIFTMIDQHRMATATFDESLNNYWRHWKATNGSDHPTLTQAAGDMGDREAAATVALLTTPPTTLAGAVALLRYIADMREAGMDPAAIDCGNAGRGHDALVASLTIALAPHMAR